MTKLEKFKALGISDATLKALEKKWFEVPSPIQEKTIPLLLAGDTNIIWQAATGSGKTAAFWIPLAEKITEHSKDTQAIILAPTRELAIQVAEEIRSFIANKKINVVTIYGWQSYTIQNRALKQGADIIVGTPGRVIDHINKGRIILDNISYFVLDEADEMLNMGFIDDIKEILAAANDDTSMLFFSATMPKEILRVAKKYMGEFEVVSVKKKDMTASTVEQIYFEVNYRDKFEALSRIIDVEEDFFGIIFCRTKVNVEEVAGNLKKRGYFADYLHGDVEQRQRERILKRFKEKKLTVLVATDVAARGIDVNNITHVINYSLPQDPESYVHRVGRTGRAGNTGTAITFITPDEYKRLLLFKRVTKASIEKGPIPEVHEIIKGKKRRLRAQINAVCDGNNIKQFHEFADEMLADHDAKELVSALLLLAYEHDLSEHKYKDISEVNVDKAGVSRLFVALGRSSGYDARKLVNHIAKTCDVPPRSLQNVTILDDFSFVTAPFEEAEAILHKLGSKKNLKRGEKPLVTKAKERKWGGGRWGRDWYRWGNNGGRGRSGWRSRNNYRRR